MNIAIDIKKMVGPSMVGLLLLSEIGVSSCHRDKEVLSEKKLVSLLADLEVAQIWQRREGSAEHLSADSVALAVLKAHGVTPAQLDSTMGWYGKNVDDYQKLYARVEKELDKRLTSISKQKPKEDVEGLQDLWTGPRFARIGGNGNTPAIVFSIENPEMEPGQILEWKMRNSSGSNIEMLLGGEYAGGDNVYTTQVFYSSSVSGMKFYTDSTRMLKRIYGVLRPGDGMERETTLIDSISLQVLPLDSNEYFRQAHQKKYRISSRGKKNS